MKRSKKITILGGATIVLGIIYYFLVRHFGGGIPCLIYKTTGQKCPGCGITRMFVHLSKFQIKEAFGDNQLMFLLWPFIIAEIIYVLVKFCKNEELPKWNLIIVYFSVGIAVIFTIFRNV